MGDFIMTLLSKIHVKNFMSLRDISLNLGPFTVLIGPNNCGKSNILSALRFVALSAERREVYKAFGNLGFVNHVFDGREEEKIEITLHMKGPLGSNRKKRNLVYHLAISGGAKRTPFVSHEKVSIRNKKPIILLERSETGTGFYIDESSSKNVSYQPEATMLFLSSMLDRSKTPTLMALNDFLHGWRLYDLIPREMRQSSPAQEGLVLERSGENLAQVFNSLPKNERERIEEIFMAMFPEVASVETRPLAHVPQTQVLIQENRLKMGFGSALLSSGELKLLGLLVVLNSLKKPLLLSIEEPENNIHPALVENVVDLLRTSSEDVQIIATTHSPVILDYLRPEEVVVVTKKDGATIVEKRKSLREIRELLTSTSFGDLWRSGALGGTPE